MTSITTPVRRDRRRGRSPIGGLAWNSWRTHRLAAIGLCALFAACAVRIGITGIHTHAVYASYLRHHCLTARLPLCHPRLIDQMGNDSWISGYVPWL